MWPQYSPTHTHAPANYMTGVCIQFKKNLQLRAIMRLSSSRNLAYHKRDVDCPHNVHLRVACGLLGHKHKRLGVEGIDLGAILQESHIFPWPVFPVEERTTILLVQMSPV